MFDPILLRAVRRKSESALGQIIDRYTAYLCVVIRNTVGGRLTREDIEETASDVFFALWENADRVEKLKPWLSATARNRAKNKLRELHGDLSLDEARMSADACELNDALWAKEERQALRSAISQLDSPDRDILRQYYYHTQTAAAIGAQMGMTESAVKQRLLRGRKKLKTILDKEVCGQ